MLLTEHNECDLLVKSVHHHKLIGVLTHVVFGHCDSSLHGEALGFGSKGLVNLYLIYRVLFYSTTWLKAPNKHGQL